MFRSSPSRAVQQLQQLKQQQGAPPPPPDVQVSQAAPLGPPTSRGFFGVDHWWRQFRQYLSQDSQVFAHLTGNQSEVARFHSDVSAKMDKYATEVGRVVMDERVQKRAEKHVRSIGVHKLIHAQDSVEICTLTHDRKATRMKKMVDDEGLLEKSLSVLRLMHDRAITDIQIDAYGLQFDPDRNREEDY
ncbi:MAG: hypothetical protein AAFV43_11035 [Planctomycetota bacterium]